MKILLVSTHYRTGGAARAAARLMQALKLYSEHEVQMLVQKEADPGNGVFATSGWFGKRLLNLARFIWERLTFLPRERSGRIRFLFSPANVGESLIRNRYYKEADLIHLHWINGAFISLRALKKILHSGKPVIWTFHDMWAFTGGCHYALECAAYHHHCGNCPYLKKPSANDFSQRIWKRKEKVFRNSTGTVITPSRWLADCAKSSPLLERWEIRHIVNPFDVSVFKPCNREVACGMLGLDPAKKYILFGAASVRSVLKGFEYFLEGVKYLKENLESHHHVEILLFGKTEGNEAGLFPVPTRSVDYISDPGKLSALYSLAHVFVISSVQDNLPNTIVESMLCGTPVVGFRTGGIPEMIAHKKTGYIADLRSSKDLAAGMQWALDTESYAFMSVECRESAIQIYNSERVAREHEELYEQVMQKNK